MSKPFRTFLVIIALLFVMAASVELFFGLSTKTSLKFVVASVRSAGYLLFKAIKNSKLW
jgi:hypothetical protein